jgi:hypothetical protein
LMAPTPTANALGDTLSQRVAEAVILTSAERVGNSFDNAVAESPTFLQDRGDQDRGPWRAIGQVEYATLE